LVNFEKILSKPTVRAEMYQPHMAGMVDPAGATRRQKVCQFNELKMLGFWGYP
jgi:hypothetical protein